MIRSVRSITQGRSFVAFVVYAVLAIAHAQTPVTVVEYYNRTLDAYFITGRNAEQATLDRVSDFQCTGMSFAAVSASAAPPLYSQICRYYVNIAEPFTKSHFYGVKDTDCVLIANARIARFANEGFDFATALPTPVGRPASDAIPVFRTFRAAAGGKSSNHRYTVSIAIRDSMVARGWVNEGIAFCAASGSSAVLSSSISSYENFLLGGGLFALRIGTTTSGQAQPTYVVASLSQSGSAPDVNGVRLEAPWINITKTLPTPDTSTWSRDRVYDPVGDRINTASIDPIRFLVRYVGDAIRFDTLTREASATAFSTLLTGAANVPLNGRLATLPAEVLALHPELALGALSGVNTNADWFTASAYQKRAATRGNDTWLVSDCATPTAFGSIPTPCAGTAGKRLEAIFPWQDTVQGKSWQFTDGTVRILPNGGPRAWIANTALPSSASPTLGYRVFYEGDPGDPVNIGAFSPSGDRQYEHCHRHRELSDRLQ